MSTEGYNNVLNEFLALIMGGSTPGEAAQIMGCPLSHFRKLRNPLSKYYDADFAQDYDDAMEACRKYQAQQIKEEVIRRELRRWSA